MSRLTALRLAVAATLVDRRSPAPPSSRRRNPPPRCRKRRRSFSTACRPIRRRKASFPFESEERLRWHFIPNETFPRKGLMIKDMNEAQRRLAHDLLRSGLSARGYLKVTSIIELEDILKAIETGGKMARDKEEYLFSVFGTPAAKGRWGWRVEGHHISLASRLPTAPPRAPLPARRCSSDRIRRKCGTASEEGPARARR